MSLFDGYIVNQEIKTVIKIYPDFVRLYEYETPFLLKRFDYDPKRLRSEKRHKTAEQDTEDSQRMSLWRAQTTVIDIALCNAFELFVTFTFAKDRYDIDAKKRQMAYWLNNQRILHGKFSYIIVPEYHKDGALHFHALFCGYSGSLIDSGVRQKGREVYNVTSYKGGFTTAVKIDDLEKVASYVAKYLTKDMPKFRNKQRYWCSSHLKRPLKIVNPLLSSSEKELFRSVYKNDQKEIFEYRGQLPDSSILRIADYGKRREDDLLVAEW